MQVHGLRVGLRRREELLVHLLQIFIFLRYLNTVRYMLVRTDMSFWDEPSFMYATVPTQPGSL